jgi:hypothetical protein
MKKVTDKSNTVEATEVAAEVKPLANINGVYVHPTTKLNWLIEANPKRPSGRAYARFAAYMTAATVQEYLDNGGTMADLKYDHSKGYVAIAE